MINLPLIIFVIIAALALIIFTIFRNRKDEKEFEKTVNEEEDRPPHHTNDETYT